MTLLARLQADPRLLDVSFDNGYWTSVSRAGWWPRMETHTTIGALYKRTKHSTPLPTVNGKFPSVVGVRCSVPAYHVPGRPARRRWHGAVQWQSDCGNFIVVALDCGREAKCAITQARDWHLA